MTSRFILPTQPGLSRNTPGYSQIMANIEQSATICYFYEVKAMNMALASIPILPDGCMDLVFVEEGNSMKSYIFGTNTSLSGYDIDSNHRIFGVRFMPGGIGEYFPIDAKEIRNIQINLDDVCRGTSVLYEELLGKKEFHKRVEVFWAFLKMHRDARKTNKQLLKYCLNELSDVNFSAGIRDLSTQTQYSARYIEKLFDETVGMSPKAYFDVARIQMVTSYIQYNPDENLLHIASRYGFVDQSHMNRKFRKYVNATARQMKNTMFFAPEEHAIEICYKL